MWNNFKLKSLQWLGGLFMEEGWDGKYVVSSGKVGFWLVLGSALYIWLSGHGNLQDGVALKDISPNHLTALLALMAYNFGKKGLDHIESIWGKKLSIETKTNEDGPG